MALILSCFIFVVLTSTSANNRYIYQYTGLFNSKGNRPDIHIQNYRHYVPKYMVETHIIGQSSTERPNERERMNERSIAVNSGVQRGQKLEKKMLQTSVGESHPRAENGSCKVMNTSMNPRPHPVIAIRRGGNKDGPNISAECFKPEIPQECERLGFCHINIKNYPYDIVNSLIAELKIKPNRLDVDVLSQPEIAPRHGPGQKNIQLCDFTEKLLEPQAAQTESGEWYFILYQKDVHLQMYRAEICKFIVDSSSETPDKCDNVITFHNSFTARCKQEYMYRAMAAIDVKNREIIYDKLFKVPSCCSCVASKRKVL